MPVLDWLGKDKVINHHRDAPFHFLDKKFSIGASDNKIIHGDNLLALKSLLPEYAGKVKCIYIDPPYNTGNEGWIYNYAVNDPHIKRRPGFDEPVFKYPYVYTKNYEKTDGIIPRNLMVEERFGRTRSGKTELAALFDNVSPFAFPKPSKYL